MRTNRLLDSWDPLRRLLSSFLGCRRAIRQVWSFGSWSGVQGGVCAPFNLGWMVARILLGAQEWGGPPPGWWERTLPPSLCSRYYFSPVLLGGSQGNSFPRTGLVGTLLQLKGVASAYLPILRNILCVRPSPLCALLGRPGFTAFASALREHSPAWPTVQCPEHTHFVPVLSDFRRINPPPLLPGGGKGSFQLRTINPSFLCVLWSSWL